ncbi:MAG: hypothetical protein U1G08_18170 [Verrucomicrobiota bacterium]
MRITISSGSDVCVLSDHGMESPSGLGISSSGVVQVAEFVRAVNARPLDRMNRRAAVEFSVTRLHRDIITAQVFLVEHMEAMVWEGTLTIESRGTSGQRAERYVLNAVVEAVRGNHIGATTIHQYQIIGGALVTKKPKS